MTNQHAEKYLAQGRFRARMRFPYLASLLYGIIPIEITDVTQCDTLFITPHLVMGYNPDYLLRQSIEKVAGCILHEANHILRDTSHRLLDATDMLLRNMSADIPINDDLTNVGIELPEGVCYASTFGFRTGLTMEAYYALLLEYKAEGGKIPIPSFGAGQCGSGAGNPVNRALEEALDKAYGRGTQEVRGRRITSIREMHDAKLRGILSGDMTEVIEVTLGPTRIPWATRCAAVLQETATNIVQGSTDFSMRRPSPLNLVLEDGILRPGCIAHAPLICICLDTSGSMSTSALTQCLTEVGGVLQSIPGIDSVLFVEADASIAATPRELRLSDLSQVEVHGRGGTDFTPFFKMLDELPSRPNIAIYFTDCIGTYPDHPPHGIETIWCVPPDEYRRTPMPWGHTIFMEDY